MNQKLTQFLFSKRLAAFFIAAVFICLTNYQSLPGQTPGTLDTTFGSDGTVTNTFLSSDQANAVVRQSDGKLVVAGSVKSKLASTLAFGVIRMNTDGSLDSSFNGSGRVVLPIGFYSRAFAVALQTDGKILVAGSTGSGFDENYAIARFNPDGSVDTTFNGTGTVTVNLASTDTAYTVLVQSDEKIVLVGTADSDFGLVRLNADGSFDTAFGNNGIIRTQVGPGNSYDLAYAGLLQSDGKIVAVGNTNSGINNYETAVVRYNSDGTLDTSFDGDGKVLVMPDAPVSRANAVVQQSDGKLVVGGKSSGYDAGNTDMTLIRLNTDGSLDIGFGGTGKVTTSISATGSEEINSLTIQADNKIIVAGYSSLSGSVSGFDFALARYNSDGSLDTSFDGDGILIDPTAFDEDKARAVLLSPEGKIIVAGFRAETSRRQYEFAVLKLNQDGSRDSAFSSDGLASVWVGEDDFSNEQINALATQPDEKIVAVGKAQGIFAVARYKNDGSLDPTFDGDGRLTISPLDDVNNQGDSSANAVLVQPDGKIVVVGSVSDLSISSNVIVIARFLPDGTPDTSFNGNGKIILGIDTNFSAGRGVALQPDGKIVVVGETSLTTTKTNFVVARYNADGSPDTGFDGDGIVVTSVGTGYDAALSVAVQADGKIVTGGTSSTGPNGIPQFAAVRYNTDGTLDMSFDGDGKFVLGAGINANSIVIQPDQKIILGGDGGTSFAALRLNPNGSIDFDYGQAGVARVSVGYSSEGRSMVLQGDGKIVLAGFSRASQLDYNDFTVVRFDSNGVLDPTFDNDGVAVTSVTDREDEAYAVALQPDGKIVAAGSAFSEVTKDDFALARYNSGFAPSNRKAFFDFDGDGKTDVSIFRPSIGEWWYLRSSDGGVPAVQFGSSTDKIVPADYTGDGKTDIAFWRESTGQWFIIRSEDSSFYAFPFGQAGDIAVPADFDGDGKADPTVFRPSYAVWYSLLSSNGQVSIRQFGSNGDVALPADYDGDNKADLAIFRPGVSEWWIQKSSNTSVAAVQFGSTGDNPTPADFTGDGKIDIAFFRPSTGFWYVLRSEDNSFYAFPFGSSGDTPTAADYDGDGRADAAVFRPTNNIWYLQQTTSGFSAVQFGASGDLPVPAAFTP